jgi:hypothetical protein
MHLLFVYWPKLHVSVAFCDHLQSAEYQRVRKTHQTEQQRILQATDTTFSHLIVFYIKSFRIYDIL